MYLLLKLTLVLHFLLRTTIRLSSSNKSLIRRKLLNQLLIAIQQLLRRTVVEFGIPFTSTLVARQYPTITSRLHIAYTNITINILKANTQT